MDPRQDEVSGGLPDDMDIVAIGGDRSVAATAVGFPMASGSAAVSTKCPRSAAP